MNTKLTKDIEKMIINALNELQPEILFNFDEPPFLQIQVVSDTFKGLNMAERIFKVIILLELLALNVCINFSLRIEAFSKDEYKQLPDRLKITRLSD